MNLHRCEIKVRHEARCPAPHRAGPGPAGSAAPGARGAAPGGRERASILADAAEEAGALYLDAGFGRRAQAVARRWYEGVELRPGLGKDAKTALQEWLQARRRPLPVYEVVAIHGEAHAS